MIRGSELQRNPVYMKRTRVDLEITLLNTESFLLIEGDKKDASPGPIIGINWRAFCCFPNVSRAMSIASTWHSYLIEASAIFKYIFFLKFCVRSASSAGFFCALPALYCTLSLQIISAAHKQACNGILKKLIRSVFLNKPWTFHFVLLFFSAKMVMPANKPRIIKKRKKRFIRHQSDRFLRVKVCIISLVLALHIPTEWQSLPSFSWFINENEGFSSITLKRN